MERVQLFLLATNCNNAEIIFNASQRAQVSSLGTWIATIEACVVTNRPEEDLLKQPIARVHLSTEQAREDSLALRAWLWAWSTDLQTGQRVRERLRHQLSEHDELGALFAEVCLGPGRRASAALAVLPACTDCGRPTGSWCDNCEDDPGPSLNLRSAGPSKFLRPFCTKCENRKEACSICNLVAKSCEIEEVTTAYIRETGRERAPRSN